MTIDWARYLKEHGVKLSGKIRKGVWIECQCPFCTDHHIHGAVNAENGGYNCWKCGKHTMHELVAVTAGTTTDKRDVMQVLAPYRSNALSSIPVIRPEKKAVNIVKNLKMPGTSPLGKGCRAYLKKRGFNPDYMEKTYGLKDGGLAGDWAYRLMIPIYIDNELKCWQGRTIGNDKIRYKSSSNEEGENIKYLAYNLDNCKKDKVVVVEGVFDAWKLGPDVCSLFGISVKDKQLQLLADRYKEVYILFDSEPAAQESAMTCVKKLQNLGVQAYNIYAEELSGKDPGDMCREEVLQVRREVLGDYNEDTPWLIEEE